MGKFLQDVQIMVDNAKADIDQVVRATGLKILARLIERSPVGNPDLWKVNQDAVLQRRRVSDINAAMRDAKKRGRVKLSGGVYSGNSSRVGPVKPRLLKRGQGVLSAPKGYTGGRFRGNWQVSFNEPAKGETGIVDKTGSKAIIAGTRVLAHYSSSSAIQSIYFTNNVPYAVRLEFGWSSQAPAGMVRVTAREFSQLFEEANREKS